MVEFQLILLHTVLSEFNRIIHCTIIEICGIEFYFKLILIIMYVK